MKKSHNVHGKTRTRSSLKKKQISLALCVSLWMAGGSVASAEDVSADKTISSDKSNTEYNLTKDSDGKKGHGVTFTVANGGVIQRITSEKSGNTVIVESGGKIKPSNDERMTAGVSNNVFIFKGTQEKNSVDMYPNLYGGYYNTTADKKIENNEVTIDGCTVGGAVYGGMIAPISDIGTVTNNIVTVKNKSTVKGIICGGQSANAQENKVYIMNHSDVGNVYGGESRVFSHSDVGSAQSNWVTVSDSTVRGEVIGAYAQVGMQPGTQSPSAKARSKETFTAAYLMKEKEMPPKTL